MFIVSFLDLFPMMLLGEVGEGERCSCSADKDKVFLRTVVHFSFAFKKF